MPPSGWDSRPTMVINPSTGLAPPLVELVLLLAGLARAVLGLQIVPETLHLRNTHADVEQHGPSLEIREVDGGKDHPCAHVGDGGVHIGEGRGRYALRGSELTGLQDVAASGELLHVIVVVADSR